jgi:predicted  nucleic acid-binding Zn-ribbon protein
MLYSPEERRLTQAELDERVDLVRFENIINPINTVCSITHDVFESAQQVARIRHCGHIFNPDSLAHWLRMNNTCPTCRHNLFTSTTTTTTRAATSATTRPAASVDTRATTSADTRAATSATTRPAASVDTRATTSADTRAAASAAATADGSSAFRRIDIPLESEININTFYNELLQNSQNIPGFELNSVNDDSIIFSFDLMNNRLRSGITGPSASGPSASGPSASGPNAGPRNIDHVD